LTALISLTVLAVVLFSEGKDMLPGPCTSVLDVCAGGLWCPLSRGIWRRKKIYTAAGSAGRPWPLTVCGSMLWALPRESLSRASGAGAATGLLNLVGAVMLAGGLFHAILKKQP